MKTLLRVFAVTVFLTTVGIISANAQDEKCPDLAACFELFKAELNKPCGSRDKAVEYGQYIAEKFKDDADNAELVKKIAARAAKIKEEDRICKRNAAYNDTYKAKRWDDFFGISKEIMNDPATTDKGLVLDLMLTHVSTGFDRAAEKNDAYNNDTLMYAKTALLNIEAGQLSKSAKWGVFAPFSSKENAVSWMNYTIGFINYYRLGESNPAKKDEAISYFFKASQVGEKKTDPYVYREIGIWYASKATDLFAEYQKIVDANNKTATDEAKAKLALARAYADRAIDAFGRAQKLATDAKLKTDITESLTEFYKFRFNGKTEGLDKYVADMVAKPMPDPSSTVVPVVEEPAPTTTGETTTTTTVPTVKTATAPTTATKPVTAPAATTVKAPTPAATTSTKPAATVKKPAQRKKGTR